MRSAIHIGRLLRLALATLCVTTAARAQVATDITSDSSTGTTIATSGGVWVVDGGLQAGANLYHSFGDFTLAGGDSAIWQYTAGDPAGISSVINRVTGGAMSEIEGTIDSTGLPNANFYFINPAGIVFGNGAALNVPAAAYFGATDEIRFAGGLGFSTTTPSGSTLSAAPPTSFGFVGARGDIFVHGVSAGFTSTSTPLLLAGREINIVSSNFDTGGLDLLAVGNVATRIAFDDPTAGVDVAGALRVSDSFIRSFPSSVSVGSLRIAAGSLELAQTGFVTDALGSRNGGNVIVRAHGIALDDAYIGTRNFSSLSRDGGSILVTADNIGITGPFGGFLSYTAGSGTGGDISIQASALTQDDGFFIADALGGATGAGGSIVLAVDHLLLQNNALLATRTFDQAASGDLRIMAHTVEVRDGSSIGTFALHDQGPAGDLTVDAGSVMVADSFLGSRSRSGGDAGNVSVHAVDVSLVDGGEIGSTLHAAGDGGDISIQAENLQVQGGLIVTGADFGAIGAPGDIDVVATHIALTQGGEISSNIYVTFFNPHPAGNIHVRAHDLIVDGYPSGINSENFSRLPSAGGSIAIEADRITLTGGAGITSDSTFGPAGDIFLILPPDGILVLQRTEGELSGLLGDLLRQAAEYFGFVLLPNELPVVISTSSPVATGGAITILAPRAIVVDGAYILARGDALAAEIDIQSAFWINSAEHLSRVSVDGTLVLDASVQDVSRGAHVSDVAFVDASRVLRGQCQSQRNRGETSGLAAAPIGPFSTEALAPAYRAAGQCATK